MFASIKTKLWELLKAKEVSLAMLYNRDGEILWQKGREILGRTVEEGVGFARSYLLKTLETPGTIEEEDVIITSECDTLSKSAHILQIKSLLILPISDHFFLYVDSGAKDTFNDTDREVFKVIGSLLSEMINQVRKNQKDIGGISGETKVINQIRELVLKYSIEEDCVLLLGETGVGKSRIAELIHHYSGRKGNFFTINTPGIPDNLFESEIFGHCKGAFTDAKADKSGYVHEAEAGTLFFDEISEVPLTFQAKLLRFIETKKYTIIGDSREREADVRIVAATNKNLQKAIENKEFREDLYYRLQILEIEIPPLRKRKEDIKSLVLENQGLLKGKTIGPGFWESMIQYNWPGNIRELITVLTRAGIHASDPITGEDVKHAINQTHFKKPDQAQVPGIDWAWEKINEGQSFWDVLWHPFIERELNKSQLRNFLKTGFEKNQFSLKKLSINLNIKDTEFKRFISTLHKYNIHPKKM